MHFRQKTELRTSYKVVNISHLQRYLQQCRVSCSMALVENQQKIGFHVLIRNGELNLMLNSYSHLCYLKKLPNSEDLHTSSPYLLNTAECFCCSLQWQLLSKGRAVINSSVETTKHSHCDIKQKIKMHTAYVLLCCFIFEVLIVCCQVTDIFTICLSSICHQILFLSRIQVLGHRAENKRVE